MIDSKNMVEGVLVDEEPTKFQAFRTKTKRSFLNMIAEPNLYPMLFELGYTEREIDNFMFKRVARALVGFSVVGVVMYYYNPGLIILAVLIGFLLWKNYYTIVSKNYRNFIFARELDFWRLIRMLLPFLASDKSIYTILDEQSKILANTGLVSDKTYNHGSVEAHLKRLMADVYFEPGNVFNFISFAEACSNSDRAVLILSAIHDKAEYSEDASVVFELGEIATNELFKQVNEVTKHKLKKLNSAPPVIALSIIILVIGFAAGFITTILSQMAGVF